MRPPSPVCCNICGLPIARIEDTGAAYGALLEGRTVVAMLACLAGGSELHGESVGCPGAPRLELVPIWRALLDLLVG